jgi:hypothetical protein
MADRDRKVMPKPLQGSIAEVKNLYFDVAASTNPVTLTGLLKLVPATHVMLGTDYPFLGAMPYTIDPLYKLGLSAEEVRSIERETALQLFPRLVSVLAA